ncbi:hypothetical protein B0H11DRAFT_2062944, partial [Mycena galericulata]
VRGLERERGHRAAQRRQRAVRVERTEEEERAQRRRYGVDVRRVHELELLDVLPEAEQLQHRLREAAAQDFGLGRGRHRAERVLRVQAVAHAGALAPRTPRALQRVRLRDIAREQRVEAAAGAPRKVPLLLALPRVDDVAHPGDRNRRLRDVRREDALARTAGRGGKHPVRLRALEGGVHGHDEHRGVPHGELAREELDRLLEALDVLLPGEEDEDVARRLVDVDLEEGAQGGVDVVRLPLRAVVDLDWVLSALDVDDLCVEEEPAELLGVERRAHNDDLERVPFLLLLPLGAITVSFPQNALQIRQQQIRAQRPLVRLIHNNHAIPPQ